MKNCLFGCLALLLSVIIMVCLAQRYIAMWEDDLIVPGPGVTEVKWLSDYVPELRGTFGDTRVFILEGEQPGANMMVMSGVHSTEPGGWMSGIVLAETALVHAGKLVVLPQANNSGFTHTPANEGYAPRILISRPDGTIRSFRKGSRESNPVDHWPDPDVYRHYPTGFKLSGMEARNLNRAHPGRAGSYPTQLTALAIRRLIIEENIDLEIDLHEARPEYNFINAISSHPRAEEISLFASFGIQARGLHMGLENAPGAARGLSTLEFADHTQAMPVTMETVNPEQGRMRGLTDSILSVRGQDAFYDAAYRRGDIKVWSEAGSPLELRVGRHITACLEFAAVLPDATGKDFVMTGVPDYDELMQNGVGHYLNAPPARKSDSERLVLPWLWRHIF